MAGTTKITKPHLCQVTRGIKKNKLDYLLSTTHFCSDILTSVCVIEMAPHTYRRNIILACILKENSYLTVATRKDKHGYYQNCNASRTFTHILEAVTLSEEAFVYQQ